MTGGGLVETEKADPGQRERWEAHTGAALLIASALFLLAYSLLVLAPELAISWRIALGAVIGVIWAAYIVDVIVRVVLTPRDARARFLRTHPSDAASALVPFFRPFQLLRHLSRVRWLEGSSGASVRSRLVVAALAYVTLFMYVIALGVLASERNAPNATIVSFGDAIWWACVTVTTVGYGDYSPVTVTGRLLAVILMAGGIAIIGTASATIVSYLTERISHPRQPHPETSADAPKADDRVSTQVQ
jgi:voltage-gated potassium channel